MPHWAQDLLDREFLGNSMESWAIALGMAIVLFIVLAAMRQVLLSRAKKMAERKRTGVAELLPKLVGKLSITVVIAIALSVGSMWLVLPDQADRVVRVVVVLGIAFQAILWGGVGVDFGIAMFLRRHRSGNDQRDASLATSMIAVKFAGLLLVYAAVVLLALENMNVDVTAMIAGLGVGGIAIALAVQSILGDLFGSLTIVLDQPFVVGDFIIVGDKLGTVEKIGLKTTRLRSLGGEQLVFSNSDLLSSRIQNYKRMNERRIVFGLGVEYSTPPETLEQIPKMIRKAIESQDRTRFDRAHFQKFGPSSLDFEAVYYMLVPDYNSFMDTQQAVNFSLVRQFRDAGISFAFPTQTLHVASLPEGTNIEPEVGPDRGDAGKPALG